jgi:type II secretory pathway component GspD/PulD (secretin)
VSTVADLARNVMTRVYDIRDLLVVVPDFEKGPDDHVTATTQPTHAQLVEQLTSLLQETVDAGHWQQNSKNTSNQMREVSGQLIVTATPQTHKEISALLDQLREIRAVQITLEMRFVSVDLQQLPKPLAALLRQTFEQNKWNEAKSAYLTDEQTNELIRQEEKLKDSSLITAPRITLFNGQRAYVEVGTGRAYVAGFTLVKPQTGERRFEPYVQTVSSGVIINASATASADRKFITVTVNPTLRRLMEIKSAPYRDAPSDAKDLMVQVPKMSSQSLNTTMSIPDRGTAVVGGLVDPGPGIDGKATGAGRPIFLLVKPSLIVQREVAAR